MRLVTSWFLATAIVLVGWALWVFVPILVPVIVVALGLGGVSFGMVALARALERRLKRPPN